MESVAYDNIDDLTAKLDELVAADDWRSIIDLVNYENAILHEVDGGTTPTPDSDEAYTLDWTWNKYQPIREALIANLDLDTWTSADVLNNFFVFDMVLACQFGRMLEDQIDSVGQLLVDLGNVYATEKDKRDAAEAEILTKYGVSLLP